MRVFGERYTKKLKSDIMSSKCKKRDFHLKMAPDVQIRSIKHPEISDTGTAEGLKIELFWLQ